VVVSFFSVYVKKPQLIIYFKLFCKAKRGQQSCFSFFTVLTKQFFLVRKLDEYFYFLPKHFTQNLNKVSLQY